MVKYKRLTQKDKELIYKLYEEKMELRKIARTMKRSLSTIQYHLKKKISECLETYDAMKSNLKSSGLKFKALVCDELWTFSLRKKLRYFVHTAIAIPKNGKKLYYFYYLSKRCNSESLLDFSLDLPEVDQVYCDGHLAYRSVYGNKATMSKCSKTNLIENLNSQMRDKIAYLVRRTKAHSKSRSWLNGRLAMFFVNKNLGY